MTYIKKFYKEDGDATYASFNFHCPNVEGEPVSVLFPTAQVSTVVSDAVIEATIKHAKEVLIVDLTEAATLNLTIDETVTVGSELHVVASSDATARNITLGTGFNTGTIAGAISKTKGAHFVYDGTKYLMVGLSILD